MGHYDTKASGSLFSGDELRPLFHISPHQALFFDSTSHNLMSALAQLDMRSQRGISFGKESYHVSRFSNMLNLFSQGVAENKH